MFRSEENPIAMHEYLMDEAIEANRDDEEWKNENYGDEDK